MSGGNLVVRGGRLIDPAQGLDLVTDVLIRDGMVVKTGDVLGGEAAGIEQLDARGLVMSPGFIDLHCHLRDPGYEDKETIETGCRAAMRGGFTTICCMPNTEPPIDSSALVKYVTERAASAGGARVQVIGTISRGRKGAELCEMGKLADAGVVGFSDDGAPVASSLLMRNALAYSSMLDRPVIAHSEDPLLAGRGSMHEGAVSEMLGLPGIPDAAEDVMVARDIILARLTGGHLHVAHASTAGAIELVRDAKRRGVRVTVEVTPHHLVMTDEWVAGSRTLVGQTASETRGKPYDASTKVNPPLRTRKDVDALLEGLRDGTVDAIATDHAPHTWVDKECEYGVAAFGISGFETALGSLMTLVHAGLLDLALVIEKLTAGPARTFGINRGTLKAGRAGDLTIIDPDYEWIVEPGAFASRGKNTPLAGCKLKGAVMATVVAGEVAWQREQS